MHLGGLNGQKITLIKKDEEMRIGNPATAISGKCLSIEKVNL